MALVVLQFVNVGVAVLLLGREFLGLFGAL